MSQSVSSNIGSFIIPPETEPYFIIALVLVASKKRTVQLEIVEEIAYSNEQSERADDCRLSLKMHAYRVKKYIGSFYAALGSVDAICFTAGVGENGAEYREAVLDGLQGMGISIDKDKNTNFKRGEVNVISTDDSKVKIYVIPTDEELMIAKDTARLVK